MVFNVNKNYIAIVGATGLVGRTLIKIFEENNTNNRYVIHLYASENSVGNRIKYKNQCLKVKSLNKPIIISYDFVFLMTEKEISKKCVEIFKNSKYIIDNSSAFRLEKGVPLLVPEINFEAGKNFKLFANPNCTTAICALPIYEIAKEFGVSRVNVTTMQAVSGSGRNGIKALKDVELSKNIYGYDIKKTCVCKIGALKENGYFEEECKIIDELRKILNDYELKISSTCIRVPIKNCHSAVISLTLKKEFNLDAIKQILISCNEIIYLEDDKNYLPNSILASGSNKIYCGRLRLDLSCNNTILLYICSDNLRRGAAYNAYKIMEYLQKNDSL